MTSSLVNFSIAAPELAIFSMLAVVMLADIFFSRRLPGLTYFLVQISLVLAFALALPQYQHYSAPVLSFGGHYILDNLAVLLKLFIYGLSFFAFIYARQYIEEREIPQGEYYLLSLFCVLGMSVMASAASFLTIYLGLELLSLPLYALVASNKKSQQSTEAAMKYFVMGALASGMFLYGVSLLYGLTASVSLHEVAASTATNPQLATVLALIFIIVALVFKFGAVPFHLWVPDVYQGAPTSVTLFLASAPKIAAFGITIRILATALPELHLQWEQILIVVSILSMSLGNIMAIAQTNLKRMLAYSSIAHIGYSLLGILAGPYAVNAYSAAMFYIFTYVLVAAGAFGIIAMLSHRGIDFEELQDYRGLNARNPWLAFMMLLLMFSMAGVPPTVGFFAKLGLLVALIHAHFVWLAVAALMFALIGAYYYLRVVMLMYFEEPPEALVGKSVPVALDMKVAITLNAGAALVLGLLPSGLIDLCRVSLTNQ